MPEFVRTGYTRLFEVRVLHHFWLDQGTTVFDAIPDDKTRFERLLRYDVRQLLTMEPSRSTAATIAGFRGVFRTTGLGFVVAVPDDAVVAGDDVFEFFITIADARFANYTSLTLRPQQIVAVADPPTSTLHQYKANVPLLSNMTGASRGGAGAGKRLFLSREYPTGIGDGVESLIVAGGQVRQLTGDQPGAPLQDLGPSSGAPVYVHQGDVPPITPPAGATGAPARGIELSADTPPDVATVIRLTPLRADDGDFSFVDNNGRPRTPHRVFEVHFKNRSTTWRYRSRRDGTITSTEPNPLPLTYFGNAGTEQKPSTDSVGVELDNSNPPKVTRLVSEIYV